MKLQTVRELLGAANSRAIEESLERTAPKPSRLICRWEQDTRGKLACYWTLEP
jgi:hypothetical protein